CSLPIALTLVFVLLCLLFLLTRRRPPSSSLVPYTTLFRSLRQGRGRPRPVGRVHGRDHCCDRQGRLQGHALRVLRHRHRWSASTDPHLPHRRGPHRAAAELPRLGGGALRPGRRQGRETPIRRVGGRLTDVMETPRTAP